MLPQYQLAPVNPVLTAFGVAFLQRQDKFIFDKVFPWRPVRGITGRYNFYTLDDTLRDEIGEIIGTAESPEIGFTKTQKTYKTRRFGGRTFENDDLLSEWSGSISPSRAITMHLLGKGAIKCERMWFETFFKEGVWGGTYTGVDEAPSANNGVVNSATEAFDGDNTYGRIQQWNAGTDAKPSDFIKDVMSLCDVVEARSGFRPNTMVLGPHAYTEIVNQKFYRELRAENVQWRADKSKLENTLHLDNIYVPRAVAVTSRLGIAKANIKIDYIVGTKSALLCFVEPNPTPLTPTAGVTFTTQNNMGRALGQGMGFGVYRYIEQAKHSLVTDVRANWQHAIVAPEVGVFLKDIVK